ncbi:MAG: hypothetical protein J6A37_02775 [Oscillospiraceae bacterium]|nr:hypothetical protein [Oscillospiraceae bacterium]
MSNDNRKNHGTECAAIRKAYESSLGIRAVERSGYNINLKGTIHEIGYADSLNLQPSNLMSGTKAVLAKSTTAVRDDVLCMNGGKVLGRAQLKDTPKSIGDTIKRVSNGQYRGTTLVGTEETVAAYSKAAANAAKRGKNVTQSMTSSGISSTDTGRIAAETIGKSASGGITAKAVTKVAKSSALAGAVISGGIEAITAGSELANGEIDEEEFVGRVAKETVGGGLSAAGGSAVATLASAGTATLLGTSAPVWIPAAVGIGAAIAVGTAIKSIWDAIWD